MIVLLSTESTLNKHLAFCFNLRFGFQKYQFPSWDRFLRILFAALHTYCCKMAAVLAEPLPKNSKSVRKPKLAPAKVFNSHHMQYLNDKAREKELQENPPTGLSIDRPVCMTAKFYTIKVIALALFSLCMLWLGFFFMLWQKM